MSANREELRSRFVNAETLLFKFRLQTEDTLDRLNFIQSLNIDWQPVDKNEATQIRLQMNDVSKPSTDEDVYYKVTDSPNPHPLCFPPQLTPSVLFGHSGSLDQSSRSGFFTKSLSIRWLCICISERSNLNSTSGVLVPAHESIGGLWSFPCCSNSCDVSHLTYTVGLLRSRPSISLILMKIPVCYQFSNTYLSTSWRVCQDRNL